MEEKKQIKVKLDLTIDQVNIILGSLAKQPYEVVAQTVDAVRYQANEQVAQLQHADVPKVPDEPKAPEGEPADPGVTH